VQQERRTLERRQPVQRQHQGKGQIVGQFGGRIRGKTVGIEHRLRQPRADIELPLHPRALQAVEAKPRDDGDEECFGVVDIIGAGEAEVGVLHDVLRIAAAAEHAVGKREQPPPMRRERISVMRPV